MGAVPSPRWPGAHVGSRATWQRRCWTELCWHTKPIPSSPLPPVAAAGPSQTEVPSNAEFQTLLHLCPTQLHTTRTKKRKGGWEQPGLCEQAAGEVLCEDMGVEPLLIITTCMTTSGSHPHLGSLGRGQGRRAESAGPRASHGDDGWACGSQKALEVMGDAGRCRSCVPGGLWAGHCHLSVSFTSPSRRAVPEWAAMGGCWCRASSNWHQQLSRTSQFSPGFFCFSQISSVGQLSTLTTFDSLYSLPNAIRRYATQVMPCKVTFHSGVTESDLSLPLWCESPCGWERRGGCGSRLEQGLSAHTTCYHRAEYSRAPICNLGFRLFLLQQ